MFSAMARKLELRHCSGGSLEQNARILNTYGNSKQLYGNQDGGYAMIMQMIKTASSQLLLCKIYWEHSNLV